MEYLIRMASFARQRLFCKASLRRQAAGMDPAIRSALKEDICDNQDAVAELEQLEHDLAEAKKSLAASQEKETFLGQRSRQYRKVLDQRAHELRNERNQRQRQGEQADGEGDAEAADDDLERRFEQWERDEDALQKIVATHKEILESCETMRRRIRDMERQRNQLLAMSEQLENFCVVADQVEQAEQQQLQEDEANDETGITAEISPQDERADEDMEMTPLTTAQADEARSDLEAIGDDLSEGSSSDVDDREQPVIDADESPRGGGVGSNDENMEETR